jgi:hypothetical protein
MPREGHQERGEIGRDHRAKLPADGPLPDSARWREVGPRGGEPASRIIVTWYTRAQLQAANEAETTRGYLAAWAYCGGYVGPDQSF